MRSGAIISKIGNMGRFANKVSAAVKQRSSTIKVNPYELPEKALAVIANICTKQNKDDASIIFEGLGPVLYKEYKPNITFFDLIDNNRPKLYDVDFYDSFNSILKRIELELSAHENTSDTQVVVAGGFSAGKSSFLNTITGAGNLLPTGIEPVSMISTYLYFSDKVKDIVVKGVNLKDAVVLLDKDVLQCIQHSSSSKVYLASVLNKLFVEMPSKKLKGLVFIDTPGYNNSDKANATNDRTDQDMATDSFKDGNVLFWIVDIEGGAVPAKDKSMINKFLEAHNKGDGKVVIIFNKADKKPVRDIITIVDKTAKEYGLGKDRNLIDVLAYSCLDNKIRYSKSGYTMPQLLDEVRKSGNGNSDIIKYLDQIEELFDNEIGFAKMIIADGKRKKEEETIKKDKAYQRYIKDKEDSNGYVDGIKEVMITSYDELMNGCDELYALCYKLFEKWESFQDKCIEHRNEWSHSHSDFFDEAIETSEDDKNKLYKQYDAFSYNYYSNEDRMEWVDRIKTELDRLNEQYKKEYEDLDASVNDIKKSIMEETSLCDGLSFYEDEILDTLKKIIREFQYGAHKPQDARLLSYSSNDIFTAISSGNYSRFMDCFTYGVSLNTYSADGFSPLTFAIKEGAVEMVRFFISHNADITALDKNGHNAFHVAALYGYRNICDLLLKEEPSIINSKTSNGKTAAQLAEEHTFTSWLKTKL